MEGTVAVKGPRSTGRFVALLFAIGIALGVGPPGASAHWKPEPEQYGVMEKAGAKIPMSDGTILRANVYYPTDLKTGKIAAGKFPVVMVQTPYGKDFAGQVGNSNPAAGTEIGPIPYLIKRGYIDVVADIRGTGDSHGTFNLLDPQVGKDGAQLVDWAAKLPHSSGRVGLYGPSYMGLDQLMTADHVGRHSPLKALFPIIAGNDTYRDISFQGGMLDMEFDTVIFALFQTLDETNPVADYRDLADLIQVEVEHTAQVLSYTAYQALNVLSGGDQAYYGAYWRARTQRNFLPTIVRNHIPAFMVGGWFDLFQRGSPLNYSGLQNVWAGRSVAKPMKPDQDVTGRYQLLDGPWYHLDAGRGFDIYPLQLAWFDHFLKGENTGITQTDTPLHIYNLSTEKWQDASTYPLSQAKPRTFYFGAGPSGSANSQNDGTLTAAKPSAASGSDSLLWLPVNSPCSRQSDQWSGGAMALALETGNLPPNPCDQDDRAIQSGPGALTYTTTPFSKSQSIAGPIDATVFATSTRPDAEFVATVEDVKPSGASVPLTSGALLGSFRKLNRSKTWFGPHARPILPYHPFSKASKTPVPTDGSVSRFDVEIFPTFAEIPKGDRLRITLSSSDTPHLSPLPQDVPNLLGGVYSVQRNRAHASYVNVPLAPEGSFTNCSICP